MVFNNTYGITEWNYWCLCQICPILIKESIVESNGNIVDDNIIEKVCDDGKIWSISKVKRGYILILGRIEDDSAFKNKCISTEIISTIECLKRYSVEWMEDSIERTYTYVSLEFERKRKLKELLKNE